MPLHEEVLGLLDDLYAKAADVFDSPYLHGGCDEVAWGGLEHSRKLLSMRSPQQVWGEYLNAMNDLARRHGREFIVWGDHVLRDGAGILEHLDRSIIVHDGEYASLEAADCGRIRAMLTAP